MHQDIKLDDAGNNPAQSLVPIEDSAPFITVVRGPVGYMAAWMEYNSVSASYYIKRAGMTKSRKKLKAINEATSWARREKMEYRP